MKVVNNVIAGGSQFARDAGSRDQPASFQHDDIAYVRMILENWRDPIFNENVDFSVWKKTLQREC
ncbi:hypothetical protein D3C83_123730 [compost metagenome]